MIVKFPAPVYPATLVAFRTPEVFVPDTEKDRLKGSTPPNPATSGVE